jgi:hypothetical protein
MKLLKKALFIVLAAISLCFILTCSACNETKQLTGISVLQSSIAKEQVAGKASLNGLKLVLHSKDAKDETLTLTDEDFSPETLALLHAPGEQTFTVTYLGFTDTVTLTILPAEEATFPDFSQIRFADKTAAYNGEEHFLTVENLPQGVTVTYENNGRREVGTQEVTAILHFNGKEVMRLFADLTVATSLPQNE